MNRLIRLTALVLLVALLCGCNGTQAPPATKYGEFPFRVVFELDGDTHVIEDTVVCTFDGFDGSIPFQKPRSWGTSLESFENAENTQSIDAEEYDDEGCTCEWFCFCDDDWLSVVVLKLDDNTNSALNPKRVNERSSVVLHYGYAVYYMGDPNGEGFIHAKPHLCYYEYYQSSNAYHSEGTPISHSRAEELFGIKIIEWDFSEPIDNTFRR